MHKQFLLAALDQAWLGRGSCAPNPSVGAVAVQNGNIIAQAWHKGAGTPHAEQLLLSQLKENLSNITLYVTLEPCNHWGRTPPCVDAIIQHGIKKVVYASCDPNPTVVANNTPTLLTQHGIEVIHNPIDEIEAFYKSYHYWTLNAKPWVTTKIAQTFDGKISGEEGMRVSISNSLCAEFTHQQRAKCDVILTTGRTVDLDDPLLNVRTKDGYSSKPLAIIASRGRLNSPRAKVLSSEKKCHIYYNESHQIEERYPNCSYHPISAVEGRLDLCAIIKHLGQLGYHDVWVEAGGLLFNSLHQARLVQRTHIYLAPKILGPLAMDAYSHVDFFKHPHAVKWQPMGNNMIVSLDWLSEKQEKACSQV